MRMLHFVTTVRGAVFTAALLASTVLSAQTFTRTQTISVDHPRLLKLADVNGDGKLDLIYSSTSSALVSIRLGNGDGTFQTTGPDYTIFSVNEFEFPDLNKDGKIDLLLTGDVASIQTYFGNGNGTFTLGGDWAAVQACNHSDETNSLSVVDVNHDGKLDVVASTSCLAV